MAIQCAPGLHINEAYNTKPRNYFLNSRERIRANAKSPCMTWGTTQLMLHVHRTYTAPWQLPCHCLVAIQCSTVLQIIQDHMPWPQTPFRMLWAPYGANAYNPCRTWGTTRVMLLVHRMYRLRHLPRNYLMAIQCDPVLCTIDIHRYMNHDRFQMQVSTFETMPITHAGRGAPHW